MMQGILEPATNRFIGPMTATTVVGFLILPDRSESHNVMRSFPIDLIQHDAPIFAHVFDHPGEHG